MKGKNIEKQIKNIAKGKYENYLMKSIDYELPACDLIINKGKDEEQIYPNLNEVNLFSQGFMVIRSIDPRIDSTNIDYIDIETLEFQVR